MSVERFGPYELVRRLGRGGMAEVFLARVASASGSAKLVALKRLMPGCSRDGHLVELLVDEARITVQLQHPNIVHLFDFIQVEGSHALVLEYVDGVDLRALVPTSGPPQPLPLNVALRVVTCLLDALDHAHHRLGADGQSLGIVHRDVTPHNVLISRHGQPKLADFGVARARISSHLSRVGDVRGKFSYMPPEQAVGGQMDHRVDIFAAGVVLYELATGRQPFRAGDSASQLFLLERGAEPPSRVRPGLPSELDAIVHSAMNPAPEKRFARARDFATELRRLMAQRFPADGSASVHGLADRVDSELAARGQGAAAVAAEMMRQNDFRGSAGLSLIAPEMALEGATLDTGTHLEPAHCLTGAAGTVPAEEAPTVALEGIFGPGPTGRGEDHDP